MNTIRLAEAIHPAKGGSLIKICNNTFGARGDIQPYIALGLGLQQAGHSLRIVTHSIYQDFFHGHGLDFYPFRLDPRQVMVQQAVAEQSRQDDILDIILADLS